MSLAITKESESDDGDEIDTDAVYRILGNPRRRYALQYLRSQGRPVSVGELAEHVAAAENDVPVTDVTQAQRKSAYTALHQNHLDKLAEAGFVSAERRWGDIELTAAAEALDLEPAGRRSSSTDRFRSVSLALSLAGVTLAASFLLGAVPAAPVAAFGVLFSLLFACALAAPSGN